jgi:formylglycine-generating enzyme required for sulfatase activity/ketosteroid isomerase-like protein
MRAMMAAAALLVLGTPAGASERDGDAPAPAPATFAECVECPEMVTIPAGSFLIGSPETERDRQKDEGPQREIVFAQPFAVARTEVTRGQYSAFARATARPATPGCWSDRNRDGKMEPDSASSWEDPGFAQTDDHPVTCISWDDARAYVDWLNVRTHSGAYRLLSDAEWEYAARAGTATAYPWGDEASHDRANYGTANCLASGACNQPAPGERDQWVYTAPVGSFPANAFGLLDMHGNVGEWVRDCYVNTLDALPADGRAHQSGSDCTRRTVRNPGGSFGGNAAWLRSANRSGDPASSFRNTNVGFRVAKTLAPAPRSAAEMLAVETAWNEAIVKRDAAFVDKLIAPDFELIFNQHLVARADLLKGVADPGRNVREAGSKDQKVRIYGTTGIITGIYFERGTLKDGRSFALENRYTDVYAWTDGKWLPVSAHASRLSAMVDGKPYKE